MESNLLNNENIVSLKNEIEELQQQISEMSQFMSQMVSQMQNNNGQQSYHMGCESDNWFITNPFSTSDVAVQVFVEENYGQYVQQVTPAMNIDSCSIQIQFDRPRSGYVVMMQKYSSPVSVPRINIYYPSGVNLVEDWSDPQPTETKLSSLGVSVIKVDESSVVEESSGDYERAMKLAE